MQGDRREILRKLQQQRQSQRAASNQDEPTFDPTASNYSLRQFNASDYNDEDDEDYDDDNDNAGMYRSSEGDRTDLLKLVLYDLNSAIAPRDIRLMAIRSAMDEFDHDNETWHDEELELRADHILLQKLTYALSVDPRHEEVGYICAALEMVYRAGKTRLAKSFHEICEVILPIFVEMIKRPPLSEKKVEEEALEEEKEEVLLKQEESRGIEPNENFDPYASNAYMPQDEDDESAESVTIPAGTGEYFDHMKKMASMGNHQETAAFDQGNDIASQTLNVDDAEVELHYRYQPQRQRHYNMASVGNEHKTGGANAGNALVSQPESFDNAGVGEQPFDHHHQQQQQQQNMPSMGNYQNPPVFNQSNTIFPQTMNAGNAGTGAQYSYQPQQPQNMALVGSNQNTAAFNQDNAIDPRPVNLGNAGTGAQYSYQPQQQRLQNMALIGSNQNTAAFHQAVVPHHVNSGNAGTGVQYIYQQEQQQNMALVGSNQNTAAFNQGNAIVPRSVNLGNTAVGEQYRHQPQQLQQNMAYIENNPSAAPLNQDYAIVSHHLNMGNTAVREPYQYPQQHNMASIGNNQSSASQTQGDALVPKPVDVGHAVGEPHRYDQPPGQQQYTPEQLYALAEQISKMQQAHQASRQQIQFMGGQPGDQQRQHPSGASTLPHVDQMVPTQQSGQIVMHATVAAAPYGQHVSHSMQVAHGQTRPSYESTAFMPNQQSDDIASAAQQMACLSVKDSHLTDEEALRLRGGGDGDSVDDQADADYGHYYDENTGTVAQYPDEESDKFDQLFEGGTQFPSSASYDEYADTNENANPFLDVSECTRDSEIDSSVKRRDQVKASTNAEEDEVYNGQVPVNDATFSSDQRGEEFINDCETDQYAQYNAGEKRYDGQVEVDEDVRASNTSDAEYSENVDSEAIRTDQPMYDAQGNFALDYSEYLDKEAKQNDRATAEHGANNEDNHGDMRSDGQAEVHNMRTSSTFHTENVDNQELQHGPSMYDAQENFASDYSDYLGHEARQVDEPTVELSAGNEYNAQEKRYDDQVEADQNARADYNFVADSREYVDTEEIRNDRPMNDAQGSFASDYSDYVRNEARQFDQPTAERSSDQDYLSNGGMLYEIQTAEHSGQDKLENNSNPFAYSDFDDYDAVSNPFVNLSGRDGQEMTGSTSHGEQAGISTSENEYGDILVVEEYDKEGEFESRNIPNTVGDGSIPTHIIRNLSTSLRSNLSNSQGGDDLSFYIGDIDGTPALHDQSKSNNNTNNAFADYGTDSNPRKQGFENNAETNSRHESNAFGDETRGQTSYNKVHQGRGFGKAGQNQASSSEGWSEGSQSRESGYTVPTFKPEEESFRRDSELTGDHWSGDQSRAQEFSEAGQSSALHMVEEEDITQANDHDQDSTYNDDIFQFQEPTMAKPMASENFFSSHDASEGFVCPLAVRNVLKILRYFSRVLSAMEQLAQQPGLVDALLYQMTRNPHSNQDEEEISARVDAIACVVNLACAEENKIMLVYHPGLLDAVINIANHDPIEEAREHATIVMMNLAYAEENKVHMVNQDNLLDTLVHLLADVSPFTRRYASAALFTLACTYANTAVMARHCDGGILEALRKVLLNDPVDEARVNAAEALFNMARNNSDDTVENMGNHPKLLASLAHSVLTDYSADVRAYSARALEWLSADIHYPMKCHPRLLQALTTASQWTKTTCIAEALKMQASIEGNRKSMVEHPGLLDALAQLSLLDGINDDEVKTCAISALERLSKEPSTRHLMVRNEGVMTALTRATFAEDGYDDDDEEEAPNALLMKTALKNLAEHL